MNLKKIRNHRSGSAKYLWVESIWQNSTSGLGWLLRRSLHDEFDGAVLIGYKVTKKGKLKFDAGLVPLIDQQYFEASEEIAG